MEISETNIIFYPDINITYVITDGKCYNGSKKLKKSVVSLEIVITFGI